MSETAPTAEKQASPRHAKDERDELALLEAQLAKKRTEVNGNENFGKYDVTVPNRGESTHESYHAQRPSDGIVRDGSVFRQAESGKFASSEEYEEQNGSTQDYYDKVGGLVNPEKDPEAEEVSPFENMGVMQLAKEQAKAEALGDIAGVNEVRNVFDTYILEQTTRPDSGLKNSELDAYIAKESERYAALVEKFKADAAIDNAVNSVENEASAGVPQSTTEADPAEPTVTVTTEAYPGQAIDVKGKEVELYKKNEFAKGEEVIFNGKKMKVEDVLRGSDEASGSTAYVLIDEEGNKDLAFGEQLSTPETKESKLKAFWEKTAKSLRGVHTLDFWKEKFLQAGNAAGNLSNWALNIGTEGMTDPNEINKKQNRNRLIMMAGTAAIFVGSVVLAATVGHATSGGGVHHAAEALPGGGHSPEPSATSTPASEHSLLDGQRTGTAGESVTTQHLTPQLEQHQEAIQNELRTPGTNTGDALPAVDSGSGSGGAEAFDVNDPAFNIKPGEGGFQLLNGLHIDLNKWNQVKDQLVLKHPGNFYHPAGSPAGEVWLRDAPLSLSAKQDLNALRG